MTRPALALAAVSVPDATDGSAYDDTASEAPRLRLTPRERPPESVVPEPLRVPRGWSGPCILVEHGDRNQPNAATASHYARDTAETRDPSWWRGVLERGGYGVPALRLYAVPSMATMRGVERLASVDAGLPAPGVRVVPPERVAVVLPVLGAWLVTVTGETVDGLPGYRMAQTTWHKLMGAIRAGRV